MFERITITLLLSVTVTSVLSASFYPTCKCPKNVEKCPKLNCPLGSLPVEHPCLGCCRICGKTEGEECGGVNDIYGRCSPDLECQPGMFTFGKLSNLKGTCSRQFGFDMTEDFLKLEEIQKDFWDNWDFSFASSEPKELYNVFDVAKDYLKPEDIKQDIWNGWDFSFSSDRQSTTESSKLSSSSFVDFKPNEVSRNEIWDDWRFSFSSGSGSSNNKIDNFESYNNEGGSGSSFYNKIMYAPV